MPKYKVISPLQHSGELYKENSTIELSQKEAESLLELKAIIPVDGSTESTPVAEDPMIVTQQVSETVAEVDPHNPRNEPTDPKTAPPSTARKQQQKAPKEGDE